jgi:hypothetical protein
LRLYLRGNVAHDGGARRNLSVRILYRAGGNGNIHPRAVLGQGHAFKLAHALAALQFVGDPFQAGALVGGGQRGDRLSDDLFGAVSVEPLRAAIPAHDDTARSAAHDGVFGRLHDGRQKRFGFIGRMAGGHVPADRNVSANGAAGIPHRRHGDIFHIWGAVLAPVGGLAAPHISGFHGFPHLLMKRGTQAGLLAARIVADHFLGGITRHPGESGIDILDGAFAVGDHHGVGSFFDSPHQAGFLHFGAQFACGVRVGLPNQVGLLTHGHIGGHGQGQRQERDGGDGEGGSLLCEFASWLAS